MIKNCKTCNTKFGGRRDAKTCSVKCRKRLQRAKTAILHEAGVLKQDAEQVINTLKGEIIPVNLQPAPAIAEEALEEDSSWQPQYLDLASAADFASPPTTQPIVGVGPVVGTIPVRPAPGTRVPVVPKSPVTTNEQLARTVQSSPQSAVQPEPTILSLENTSVPTTAVAEPTTSSSAPHTPVVSSAPKISLPSVQPSAQPSIPESSSPKPDIKTRLQALLRNTPATAALAILTMVMLIGGVFAASKLVHQSSGSTPVASSQSDTTLQADKNGILSLNLDTVVAKGKTLTVGQIIAGPGSSILQVTGDVQSSSTLYASNGQSSLNNIGLTINGAVVCTSAGCIPLGSGDFSADSISRGQLSDIRLSANVTLQGNTFNGPSLLVQLTGTGLLPVLSGANLTNLNASNITSGTISDSRLSGDVALLNAAENVTGGWTFSTNPTTFNSAITVNGDSFTDLTGNGLTVSAGALTIQATASADGFSSTSSSGSGLEVLSSGLALLQGCSDTQILKWNETTDVWACAADVAGGGGATLQLAYDAGNTITTTNARDIGLTLADTAVDSNLAIAVASGSTSTVSITRADGGVAEAAPAQLLLLDNADLNVAVADGLKIQAAAGAITDGLDVSDAELVNAINIGANDILSNGVTITSAELNVLDAGIDESEVIGEIEAVTAGNGLTGGGLAGAVTLDIVSANGAIVANANDIALTLTATADALSATTSSSSGLEILASGLTLLQGCADTEILKWNETADVWACSADSTGSGVRLDQITAATAEAAAQDSNANTVSWNWDFTAAAVDSGLIISESTASTLGTQDQQALLELTTLASSTASPLQVTAGGTDVADIWFNLSGTADFEIRDAGTTVFTVNDSGLIILQPAVSLTSGQTHIAQTLTNASSTGGTIKGYSQTITIANSAAQSFTRGIDLTMTDNTSVSGNWQRGIIISLGGTNTQSSQLGIEITAARGAGLRAVSNAVDGWGALICGGNSGSMSYGICGQSQATSQGVGVFGFTLSSSSSLASAFGNGVYGENQAIPLAGEFAKGVSGRTLYAGSTAAYTAVGVYGQARGGVNATEYGGYFTLDSTSSATLGSALYATNSTRSASILQLQDNTTDVLVVADGGAFTFSPQGTNSITLNLDVDSFLIAGGDSINDFTGTGLAMSGNSLTATLGTAVDTSEITDGTITGDDINSNIAGAGLVLTAGSPDVLNVASANGGIVANADDIALTLTTTADALSATTSSGSGLEILASGLTLLQGCADTEILKWNETADVWACGADATGGTATLQSAYTAGNTILTIDARNIIFTLADLTTPTSFSIENQDTTGVSAQRIFNSIATGTLTNGLLIEQTGAAVMTNAIQIAETAGTITTGINIGNNVGTGISIGTGVTTGILVGSGGITITAGALAVNSDSITSDGLLDINGTSGVQVTLPAGTVDFTVTGLDADSTVTFSGLNSCDTIDTTAAGVLVCGTDATGAGGGIATIEENDVTVVSSATVIDFLGSDFVVGAVGSEGNISIDYTSSGITRTAQAETITGGWTFNTAATTFTTAIAANGGITFDAATDTLGAHTLAGTLDMATNIITNIGNLGTDFIAATGGLTLAGTLTVNSDALIALPAGTVDFTVTGLDADSTVTFSGLNSCDTIDTTAGGVLVCGTDDVGGSAALDTLTAATTDDAAILSGDNTIIWEWALTSAASRGITIGESAASTGGAGNQFLLELTTDAGSTASPLSIISNSADAGDIEFDLNSAGDFLVMDAGTPVFTVDDNGLLAIQPGLSLTSGQTHVSQTLTNASSTGGTVNGYSQTITVSNTSSASTTNGINIAVTDNASSIANTNTGIKIALSGSNASRVEHGANISVTRGVGVIGTSSGPASTTACITSATLSFGVCGLSTSGGSIAAGVYGTTDNAGGQLGTSLGAAAIMAQNYNSGSAAGVFIGIKGKALQSSNAAYTSVGVFGQGGGGTGSTSYGGYFNIDPARSPTLGSALYASNSAAAINILQLQDNTTDVLVVADGGAFTLSPQGTNSITLNLDVDSFLIAGGDSINDFTGTGLAMSGNSLTATLGTAVDTSEITDGTITGDDINSNIAGAGLVLTAGSPDVLDIVSANGGIVANANDIALTLTTTADALSATTSSSSGLEILASGLTLLQGCADTEILKFNETTDVWACGADATGATATLQSAYNAGNAIATTDARNIIFTLAELTTPTSFSIENQDTAGVSAQRIFNSIAGVTTLTNGLLIEQTGTGTMTNAIQVLGTAGTITNGLLIADGAGTITNGIQLTGSFTTTLLDTPSLDISAAGAITGATGVTLTSGNITTPGNISTTSTGTITSAGLLTAANGLTLTTGVLNLTATSGALALSGLGASSINTGANALTITSSNFNTTATGINSTAIGATTASTGAFTTLSSSGVSNIGSGTGAVTIDGTSLALQTTGAGSDITINAVDQIILSDFTTCTALETIANVLTCGTDDVGGSAALDTLTAATTDDAAILSGDNTIIWEWALTSAASRGITIGESAASTGGAGNQFLLELTTDAGSTASPLSIISNSADAGDIEFDLNSAGDFLVMDAGTAFLTIDDTGAYTYTLDATDNPAYTITNNGSSGVITNLVGTGDFFIQDAGTTFLTLSDTGAYTYALDGTDNPAYTITNNGSSNIIANLVGTGDFVIRDASATFLTLDDLGGYTYALDATDNPTYTITNNGSGNIITDLVGTGDFFIMDGGGTFLALSDIGAYTYTLDATDNPAYTITSQGSGNVITNLIGTGDFIINEGAGGSNFQITATDVPIVDMVAIANTGFGTITTATDGLQINFATAAVAGSVDNAGLRLVIDPVGATEAGDTVEAIDIANITNPTGLTTALRIGTGWDTLISGTTAGTNIFSFTNSSLTSAGALTVTSCAGCGGGGTLQTAYNAGNTIATTDARNIIFTLAELTTPTSFSIENQDTAGVSAARIFNSIAGATTLTNGLLIEQTGTGTLTNAIAVQGTAGTIDNGILIADGAGAITDGIEFTGTFTNLINAPNFSVSNAGAVTAADIICSSASCISTGEITDATITGDDVAASIAGDGLVLDTAATPDEIDIDEIDVVDGVGATSNNSGFEFGGTGGAQIGLLQGCANNDVLKWVEASSIWQCNADISGGTPTLDSISAAIAGSGVRDNNANTIEWNWDFTAAAVDSGLIISESTASTLGTQDQQALLELTTLATSTASPLQVTAGGTDVGDIWFNLSGDSDFEIRDAGTAFATFDNSTGITFTPTAGSDFLLNEGAGTTFQITATAATFGDMVALTNSGFASATTGGDGLQITFGSSDASGDALHIIPTYAGGATDALTYNAIEVNAFSPTNGAGTDIVNGLKIGALTDPGATITSTALNIGSGWDTLISGTTAGTNIFAFNNALLTSAGALTVTSCTGCAGTLQQAYDAGAAGDQVIALDATQDSLIFRNPAASGSDSTYILTLDQLATGAKNGLLIQTPVDTNIGNVTKTGLRITSGAITENTAANTGTYVGGDFTIGAATLTTGTALNLHGLRVTTGNITQSAGTLTENGLLVDSGSTIFTTGGTLNGINVNVPSVAVGNYKGLNISTDGTGRTFTAGANITGIRLDLQTNITATGVGLTGISVATPADTGIGSATKTGISINSGSITETSAATGTYTGLNISTNTATTTTAAGTLNATGANINLNSAQANFAGSTVNQTGLKVTTSAIFQTAGTVNVNGIYVDTSGTSTWNTGGTLNGANINIGTISVPATGVFNGLNISTNGSARTLAVNATGTFTGINLDLNTNVTASGVTLTGLSVATPTDTNIANATKKGLVITSGAITENTAANTGTYVGADITLPALTLTTGTALNAHGLRVTTGNLTQTTGTLTENGLLVDASVGTFTSGTLNGLKISNVTDPGAGGTSTALNLGTGWDTLISGTTAGTNIFSFTSSSLTSAGGLTVTSCSGCGGGVTLQTAYDAGTPTILTDASGDIIFRTIGGATDTQFEINAASAPEIDMALITNTGQANVTANVSGLSINYTGGAAAVEAQAQRIDLTGGTTTGGGAIWSGLRVVQGTITPGTTVQDIKLETAAVTQNTAATTVINGLNLSSAGALNNAGAAGTLRWAGLNIATPNVTMSVVSATIQSDGLKITQGAYTIATNNGVTNGVNGVNIIGGTIAPAGAQTGTISNIKLSTAALTLSTNGTANINGLLLSSSDVGALNNTIAAGVINWAGLNIATPAVTTGVAGTTILSDGLKITQGAYTVTNDNGAAGGVNGINIIGGTIAAFTGQTGYISDIRLTTAALTSSTSGINNINGLTLAVAGALEQNTSSGDITWAGVNIVTPMLTETTGTVIANGIKITPGLANAGAELNGLNIGNSAGGASTTETAIKIGTGWDTILSGTTAGTNIFSFTNASLTSAGALTVTSCSGCGGGLPNTAEFQDVTTEALDDLDTTDYWDGTYPNITPTATGNSVFASIQFEWNSNGAADINPYVRLVREDDVSSTTPSCDGTDPQVGDIAVGFSTATNQDSGGSGSFIDYPASTSAVYYTICSDAQSTLGSAGDTTEISVVLVELGADLAENYYTTDDSIGPGDVVVIDSFLPAGVKKASTPYDAKALGVVSTAPGITLDDAIGLGYGRAIPVALAGRIPVKVSTENGRVKTGDLLTPSSTAGVAMKATKAGQVIGQALQDFNYPDGEIGLVVAFVKTDYALGSKLADLLPGLSQDGVQPSASDLGKLALAQFMAQKEQLAASVNLSEITTDRLAAALEVITPQVTTDNLALNTIKPVGVDITMELGADGRFVIKNPAGQEAVAFDSFGNAHFAGTVTADKVKANQIEGLEILTDKISNLQSVLDSQTTSDPTDLTAEASVNPNSVAITSAKISLDLSVGGALVVSGGLSVEGPASFNGQVAFNDEAVFNSITQFLGTVSFNQDVLFGAHVIFGQDAGGTAVIKRGDSRVTIKFNLPYEQAPVIAANYNFEETLEPDGTIDTIEAKLRRLLDANYNYGVGKVAGSGFVIFLNKPAAEDIHFQWLATPIKDAKVSLSESQ